MPSLAAVFATEFEIPAFLGEILFFKAETPKCSKCEQTMDPAERGKAGSWCCKTSGCEMHGKVQSGDALLKGAGHKYVRRLPTGNVKKPWRYIYNVAGGKGGLGAEAEFEEGAKFKVQHDGKEGHFEIIGKTPEGKLRIRHDESGHVDTVTPAALSAMLRNEHATAISEHRQKVKSDLEAVKTHGSAKQRLRLLAYAKQHEHLKDLAAEDVKEKKQAAAFMLELQDANVQATKTLSSEGKAIARDLIEDMDTGVGRITHEQTAGKVMYLRMKDKNDRTDSAGSLRFGVKVGASPKEIADAIATERGHAAVDKIKGKIPEGEEERIRQIAVRAAKIDLRNAHARNFKIEGVDSMPYRTISQAHEKKEQEHRAARIQLEKTKSKPGSPERDALRAHKRAEDAHRVAALVHEAQHQFERTPTPEAAKLLADKSKEAHAASENATQVEGRIPKSGAGKGSPERNKLKAQADKPGGQQTAPAPKVGGGDAGGHTVESVEKQIRAIKHAPGGEGHTKQLLEDLAHAKTLQGEAQQKILAFVAGQAERQAKREAEAETQPPAAGERKKGKIYAGDDVKTTVQFLRSTGQQKSSDEAVHKTGKVVAVLRGSTGDMVRVRYPSGDIRTINAANLDLKNAASTRTDITKDGKTVGPRGETVSYLKPQPSILDRPSRDAGGMARTEREMNERVSAREALKAQAAPRPGTQKIDPATVDRHTAKANEHAEAAKRAGAAGDKYLADEHATAAQIHGNLGKRGGSQRDSEAAFKASSDIERIAGMSGKQRAAMHEAEAKEHRNKIGDTRFATNWNEHKTRAEQAEAHAKWARENVK